MKKKYQRGGRSGKLHNMAMRIRKNKPERYNPFREAILKREFMEQMKLLAQQNNQDFDIETIEDAINFAKLEANISDSSIEAKDSSDEPKQS